MHRGACIRRKGNAHLRTCGFSVTCIAPTAKQYVTGHVHGAQEAKASAVAESLLKYDLETSGFPSSHCGHLVLLGLSDQTFPNTKTLEDWPSWNLPILRWAKWQGAVVGYAHS